MTDNEIIKALDTLLNREYPEDIVPTAICMVEFLRGVSNIIDGLRNDVGYFEDLIDTINTEKNEIINQLKAEKDSLIKLIQSKQNIIGVWKELTEDEGK